MLTSWAACVISSGGSAEQLVAEYRYQLNGRPAQSLTTCVKGLLEYNRLTLEGNEETLAAITALGLSFDQLDSVSAEERIRLIAEAIQEIDNATLKQTLLEKLFGESDATNLFGFFDRFNELSAEAANSAPIVTDEDIDNAQALQIALANLEGETSEYTDFLGGKAAVAITVFADALARLATNAGTPAEVIERALRSGSTAVLAYSAIQAFEAGGIFGEGGPAPGFGGEGGAYFGAPPPFDDYLPAPRRIPGQGGVPDFGGDPGSSSGRPGFNRGDFLGRYYGGGRQDLLQRGYFPQPPGATSPYTVQQGDTLTAIARARGTTIDDLQAGRPQGTDPNLIHPGEQLGVPGLPTVEQVEEQGEAVAEEVEVQITGLHQILLDQAAAAVQQREDAEDAKVNFEAQSIARAVAYMRAGHDASLEQQAEEQAASLASRQLYWLEYEKITAEGVNAANALVRQAGTGAEVTPTLQFGNIGPAINTPIQNFIDADNAAEIVATGMDRLNQQGRGPE